MTIDVIVAYAAPGIEELVPLQLGEGATVADALVGSALVARLGLDPATLDFAIFGQRATPSTRLAQGDRIELTRPLVADAGMLRRERAKATPRPPGARIAKPDH